MLPMPTRSIWRRQLKLLKLSSAVSTLLLGMLLPEREPGFLLILVQTLLRLASVRAGVAEPGLRQVSERLSLKLFAKFIWLLVEESQSWPMVEVELPAMWPRQSPVAHLRSCSVAYLPEPMKRLEQDIRILPPARI